jgi:RNA polymerase sigma-70 factor (ECF subfamily)
MQDDTETPKAAGSRFEAEALPHIESLFRTAMWFERNRDEAEDLVQDTFRQALESFHRYTPGTNCRAWLMSILHHIRSNKRRARGRSPIVNQTDELLASTVPFVPPVPEHLTDEDLLGALRRIPTHYQEVIVLSDVEELPYKEIANTLSIPIGTVMSRLHRGRTLLRQELTRGKGQVVQMPADTSRSRTS